MLTKEFLCKREVLGKRSPHSFTPPPSKCGRCVQHIVPHLIEEVCQNLVGKKNIQRVSQYILHYHQVQHVDETLSMQGL
jgi:hypothetical protein